jgi:AcrR family transcriptional regulator
MVRQARSEATRRKIIGAAVDLFIDIGYAASGLGDIIERAELTKGAFYYHFESKEQLASAIIEEGTAELRKGFRSITESSAPALENMIHGVFVVAHFVVTDKYARAATQLMRAFAEFNDAAAGAFAIWLEELQTQARRASDEGDLRADLDPDVAGHAVLSAMMGTQLLSSATSRGADLLTRVADTWQLLLPAIASEKSLPYFRQFLAREAMRRPPEQPTE